MKIHELKTTGKKNKKRVGRGISSGKGKTAGRGMMGQNARSGGGTRPGFEGGQNPLMKRIPKTRGFSKPQKNYTAIYTSQLNSFPANSNVDKDSLKEKKLIKDSSRAVKIIYRDSVNVPLNVHVDKASKKAQDAIANAGGTIKLGS